jgi:ElaB/YqjD/DUF883 family membrane-anchored ribosome-binding protein
METQFEKVPSNVQDMPGRGETMQSAKDKLSETWSSVYEQARYAAQYTVQAVRNSPWISLGVGFGVGVVVGALVALAAGSNRSRYF